MCFGLADVKRNEVDGVHGEITQKKSTNCFARGAAVWTRWMSCLQQSVEYVHHNVDVQAHFIFYFLCRRLGEVGRGGWGVKTCRKIL